MREAKGQEGFSLIELMIVVAIIGFVVVGVIGIGVIGAGVRGNYWYTEAGVVQQLQEEHPEAGVTTMFNSGTNRNIWSYSEITVNTSEGRMTCLLDTNAFFDYSFSECKQE